jgi:hypothetical protein
VNTEPEVIIRPTYKIIVCEQGTPEWWQARAGIPTASEFNRIMTPGAGERWTCIAPDGETCGVKHQSEAAAEKCAAGKNKKRVSALPQFAVQKCPIELAAAHDLYINELIADRVSLNPNYFTEKGRPVTRDMTNGIDLEPEARRYYEMQRDTEVERVGFVRSLCDRYGCSPDGLVGEGGLELKCPTLPVQIAYLREGKLPEEYKGQVHGCMIVTGAPWWDFMSYNPSVDPLLLRIERDEYTAALEKALVMFCDRFAEVAATLRSGRLPKPALVGAAPTNDEERF